MIVRVMTLLASVLVAVSLAANEGPKQVEIRVQIVQTKQPEALLGVPLGEEAGLVAPVEAAATAGVPTLPPAPGPAEGMPQMGGTAGPGRPTGGTLGSPYGGGGRGAGGGGVRGGAAALRSVPMVNTQYDPAKLQELVAAGSATILTEPTLMCRSGAAAHLGYGGGIPQFRREVTYNEFGNPEYTTEFAGSLGGPASTSWLALLPMLRDDGGVVLVAAFGRVDFAAGSPLMTLAWLAKPGVPVALGELPRTPGAESIVFLVTARGATP